MSKRGQLPSQNENSGKRLWLDSATIHKLIPLLMVVFGFTVVTLVISELAGGPEKLRAAVEHAGVWAPFVYVGVKALTYIIAPLSGTSIELISGALFGVVGGTILSLLGSVIGGSANYWIARTLGRAGVVRFAGKKALQQVDDTAEHVGGWKVLLAARIILSSVYDFISYAAGLARFSFGQYLAVSIIGGIPVNIIFPLLGHASTQSQKLTYVVLGVTGLLFIVFGVLHVHHKRRVRRQNSVQ